MTIGTQVSDHRTNIVNSKGISLVQGEYFRKTWVGSDLTEEERTLKYKPEHGYECSILSQNTELGMCRNWTSLGDDFLWTPRSWMPPEIVDPWTSNDDLKLWTNLGNHARDSEFHGANFLAEVHQVPRMIADISTKLAFVLHNVRHGNDSTLKKFFKRQKSKGSDNLSDYQIVKKQLASSKFYKDAGRNTSEKMAEGLLMYDYGISPLLSDAETSMNALSQSVNTTPYRTRVKRRRIVQNNMRSSGFIWNQRVIHRTQIRGYLASAPDMLTIWHLNDPLGALIEVTPWSFVVDWVVPVSSYFSALDTLRSFDWKSLWKTTFIERSQQFVGLDPSVLRPGATFDGGTGTFDKVTSIKREQLDTSSLALPPVPTIRPAKEIFSVKHMLDAAALLIGQKTAIAKSMKF